MLVTGTTDSESRPPVELDVLLPPEADEVSVAGPGVGAVVLPPPELAVVGPSTAVLEPSEVPPDASEPGPSAVICPPSPPAPPPPSAPPSWVTRVPFKTPLWIFSHGTGVRLSCRM